MPTKLRESLARHSGPDRLDSATQLGSDRRLGRRAAVGAMRVQIAEEVGLGGQNQGAVGTKQPFIRLETAGEGIELGVLAEVLRVDGGGLGLARAAQLLALLVRPGQDNGALTIGVGANPGRRLGTLG